MKTRTLVLLSMTLALWIFSAQPVKAQGRETQTVESAMEVLQDITAIPEKGIPSSVLRNAEAVVVVPDLIKLGFLIGGRHGRGVLLVREPSGWSNPVFVTLTGGSIGWQAGAQATDVILIFQTRKGVNNILQGRNKFTLGADAAIAAGPVGRQAEAATDLQLKSEILSYSRSRGLFAGAAIEGSALRIDWKANSTYYRTAVEVSPGDIVTNRNIPGIPASGFNLKMLLAKLTAPQ